MLPAARTLGRPHEQRKYDVAEAMYREALAMQRKLLSANHPDIAMPLNNLAFLYRDRGEMEEAIRLMRESVEMYRLALGSEHPQLARSSAYLAKWIAGDGDRATGAPE